MEGVMGARAGFCVYAIALRCLHIKTKENTKHHLVEGVCSENSFSWRGECILTAVSSRV